jgi:hypothetical protein
MKLTIISKPSESDTSYRAAKAAQLWASGVENNMNAAYTIWNNIGTSQSDIKAFQELMLRQKFGL